MDSVSPGKRGESFSFDIDEYDASRTCPSLTTIENVCEAYGITLAEFLYGQDDLIHLNAEQKRHLDRWNLLTEKQQRAVELFIDGLNQIG
ncbi:MAG: hypothetical protein ACLSTN_08415 [Coprococcus sp.]